MNTDLLLDPDNLEDLLAGYLDALLPELQLSDEREPFIERWVPPFAQMTRMLQDASVTGKVDTILLATFMRDLAVAIDGLTGEARDLASETLPECAQPVLH